MSNLESQSLSKKKKNLESQRVKFTQVYVSSLECNQGLRFLIWLYRHILLLLINMNRTICLFIFLFMYRIYIH